jgi:hypothetical protein
MGRTVGDKAMTTRVIEIGGAKDRTYGGLQQHRYEQTGSRLYRAGLVLAASTLLALSIGATLVTASGSDAATHNAVCPNAAPAPSPLTPAPIARYESGSR